MRKSIVGIVSLLILVVSILGCTTSNNLNNTTNNSTNIGSNSSVNNSSENIAQNNSNVKSVGKRCSYCDGKGYYMMNLKCTTCNGIGTINDDVCPKCHGSGSQSIKQKLDVKVVEGMEP